MLTHNTLNTLRHLKLRGMCDALEQQRAQPATHDLAFEERLALLVDREVLHRENRRLDRLLKAARLRVQACIEDVQTVMTAQRSQRAPLRLILWHVMRLLVFQHLDPVLDRAKDGIGL